MGVRAKPGRSGSSALCRRARDHRECLAGSGLRTFFAAFDDELEGGGRLARLLSLETTLLMNRAGLRTDLSRYARELPLVVDRKRAAFSAWYEMMPRSQSDDPHRDGTFDDVIRK